MRRLLFLVLALAMVFASDSAEARGGRALGWRGQNWGGARGGVRYVMPSAGRARSMGYPAVAAPRTYYRSSYPSYYAGSYYVSSYAPVVQSVAPPTATVARGQVWYPPPPPPPPSMQVQRELVKEPSQPAVPSPVEDKTGTLVIAIGSNYRNRADIPHLRYAASDTENVYDTLCARQGGPVTGVLLVDEGATRSNILDAIDKAKSWRGPVLFYFSGHGSPDLTGTEQLGYLVASDTDTSNPARLQETAVSLSGIWTELQDSTAKSVFAAVDVCFTGTGKSVLTDGAKPLIVSGAKTAPAPDADREPVLIEGAVPGRILLLSSSANQPSWEDGKRLKGGIFTHYLVAGLNGAAAAGSEVRVQELVRYVKREVQGAARRLKGVDQTPQAVGKGEFVVARTKPLPVERQAYAQH